MNDVDRHTVWTPAEESMLVTGFHAGILPDRMADALRKTPGSVRQKLNALGLQGGNPDAAGPLPQTATLEDYRARQGDLAFKRAMLKAIASGAEKAVPCIVRAKPSTRYIPCVRAPSDSGYRSSAALAAELGLGEAPDLEPAERAGMSPIQAFRTQVAFRFIFTGIRFKSRRCKPAVRLSQTRTPPDDVSA